MRGSRWTRWQDWGAVVIGVLIASSPLVTANDTASLWTRVVFGVLLAASGLWSLSQPESVASEYVHIALGVLLFIAPWVMRYTDLSGPRGRRGSVVCWRYWSGPRLCRPLRPPTAGSSGSTERRSAATSARRRAPGWR
jgi:hypothetical protein